VSYCIDDRIEDYAAAHSEPLDPLLDELWEVTHEETELPRMLSGKLGAGVLRMVARLVGARRTLEVGTFTGYSALAVAEALPDDGEVITCEVDDHHASIARHFFARSPHGAKIDLRLGPAAETLAGLEGPFDFAFVDADKTGYDTYYEECLRLLRPGGALCLDNVLWSGRVLDPAPDDASTLALAALNEKIRDDTRVDRLMLTVRDGITLVRKR